MVSASKGNYIVPAVAGFRSLLAVSSAALSESKFLSMKFPPSAAHTRIGLLKRGFFAACAKRPREPGEAITCP